MKRSKDQTPFLNIVREISGIISQYTIEDIASSLFVSCLWIPNIASSVQHQLLTTIFASIKPTEYSGNLIIYNYSDFKLLLEKLYALLPGFDFQEDYVPNPDWGSVKYHFMEKDNKIFYGTDLENQYDYLQLFEILYSSYNDEFLGICGRSPKEELGNSLTLQDFLISSINCQPYKEKCKEITPGHKEIPPEDFWSVAADFYKKLTPQNFLSKEFLEHYSQEFGLVKNELSSQDLFERFAFEGALLLVVFLRYQERFFLVLPRRISEILIGNWSNIFALHKKELCETNKKYITYLNGAIYVYLKERMNNKDIYGLTNAINSKHAPHEILFAASFIAQNRLFMIYMAEPFTSSEEINQHLKIVTPKLNKAISLIAKRPVRLGLNLEKQIVEFRSHNKKDVLHPTLIVILPQATIQPLIINKPKALKANLFFLDQFLGIFDEIDNSDELVSFLEYFEDVRKLVDIPFTSMLDYFGSYRDSHGVLISGARKPNLVLLDLHWGSEMRYDSLSKFWSLYPDIGFFDHPRSWKPIKETETRVRLEAKAYFGSAIFTGIQKTKIFIIAPFERMNFEQGLITDLLMQSLEDSLSRLKHIFENHKYFRVYKKLQVVFIPSELAKTNDFKHIAHLQPNGSFWRSDRGYPRADWPGVRIVIDTEALYAALESVKDNSLEIDLLLEILNHVNAFIPDSNFNKIVKNIKKEKGGLPRFMAFHEDKEISFPEFIPAYKPEFHDYKKARKTIAELAVALDIAPGNYELTQAKELLNRLRKSVVHEIQAIVRKHNVVLSMPYLIERIDALEDEHYHQRLTLQRSLQHEVDFERDERYSSEHLEFLRQHKNYRYLIEKFTQLHPHGRMKINRATFQYVIALADQLHNIYFASDSIHYDISPVNIVIDEEYLVEVNYADDLESKQNILGREQAKISLGESGIESDRVETPGSIEDYLEELDRAFFKDLGFKFKNLVSILKVLSEWAGYDENAIISPYYKATEKTIKAVCQKSIIDISEKEIKRIIKFLTLQRSDVNRVSGQVRPCDDIPIWEFRKRYSRYTIRPFIFLTGQYYWGAYSARRAGIMWSNVPIDHSLPADLSTPSINKLLENKHKLIEKEIEIKVLDIVKRYTEYAKGNVKLHEIDKKGKHPDVLGDYDVLAFLPNENVILNIECKEISPAFCAKDSKRMREKIYGQHRMDKGYLEKIENRENYLHKNIVKIIRIMGYPSIFPEYAKVISLFVSRDLYWWMKYPIRPTNVVFMRTDMLANYMETLLEKNRNTSSGI